METTFYTLATKKKFNLALRHFFKVNDVVGEVESEKLLPMLQDLGDWFQAQIGDKYTGTRCEDIVGDLVGTPQGKQICGGVLFQTFEKVNEILAANDFV